MVHFGLYEPSYTFAHKTSNSRWLSAKTAGFVSQELRNLVTLPLGVGHTTASDKRKIMLVLHLLRSLWLQIVGRLVEEGSPIHSKWSLALRGKKPSNLIVSFGKKLRGRKQVLVLEPRAGKKFINFRVGIIDTEKSWVIDFSAIILWPPYIWLLAIPLVRIV